ncbi:hypothetical protein [Streptomyces sp. L2]|uniref:hypothetical protein n=1 Tax=Streptomyces sp. L2 TaxID=2162665 RepID=UPI001F50BEC9|nr:hypothetical protein [Streptomyces sp. L2]
MRRPRFTPARRRRDRRPARRVPAKPGRCRAPRVTVAGADVVLVGYFSAKRKDFDTVMASAAGEVAALGGRVVARMVQRRGVSDGGVQKMGLPYSSRTLLSHGKIREVIEACDRTDADVVVFVASLTGHQRCVLTATLGRPAVSLSDILSEPS